MARKSRFDQRDKRRFIEATSAAMMCAAIFANKSLNSRDIVNIAGELWDELEHQHPVTEDD